MLVIYSDKVSVYPENTRFYLSHRYGKDRHSLERMHNEILGMSAHKAQKDKEWLEDTEHYIIMVYILLRVLGWLNQGGWV
jgi:hypothetical protein